MKKIMGSLHDDDSTSAEDVRVSFNTSAMDSRKIGSTDATSIKNSTKRPQKKCSSSSETNYSSANDETKEKWMSNKQQSKLDKQENNTKNKKAICTNVRRKNYKNKESKCSDSEEGKHSEKGQKKHSISKSSRRSFITLNKDEADSSSGKEFQKSKFSRHNNLIKKVSGANKNDESDSSFKKHTEEKTMISKKQSLCFKSRVMKILNRFKEVCSDYELRMEHVKWKHLKKELVYQESANNIVNKSKSLINELKLELDIQEKELINFYEEWSKNCSIQNTDHEDSSSSENEVLENTNKKIPDKSKSNSKEGSIVSEYDNAEIFSDTEVISTKTNKKNNKENESSSVAETEKLIDDDTDENVSRVISPILGSKTEKEICNKIHTKDASRTVLNEKVSKVSHNNENKQVENESLDDIFEESTTNDASTCKSVKNKNLLSNDSLTQSIDTESQLSEATITIEDTVGSNTNSTTVLTDAQKTSESTKNDEDNSLPKVVNKGQTEKVLLESDQETPSNEECPIKKSSTKSSTSNSNEKGKSKVKEIKSNSKQDNKVQNKSTSNDTPSDEQVEIIDIENSVKRTLLDSNSDDSMDFSSDKKMSDEKDDELDDNSDDMHAKAKLLISSNSESSSLSSDSDDKLQSTKVNLPLKKSNTKNKDLVTDTSDFDGSVGGRVKKRRYLLKDEHKADKKLNMACRVVLERLPRSILRKHAKALQKSRQYLECKQIKSLINVDRLQKNQGKSCASGQISSKKKLAAKETKDSLLDHLEKVKNGEFVEDADKNAHSDSSTSTILLPRANIQTNDQLMLEADKATKNMLLNSSDSDTEHQKASLEVHDSDKEKDKIKDKSRRPSATKTEKKDDDEEDEEKKKKNKWRRNKILTMKLSSETDSDAEKAKWKRTQEKLREKQEENDDQGSNIENKIVTRKRKNRRKIVDSDSDTMAINSDTNSDSSVVLEENSSSDSDASTKKQQKKTRKRKTRKSSDTDSSFAEKRAKPKRKRIKNVSTDSDENADDALSNSQGTPGKKSRKNIRKVMKDKQVADDTKQAAKEEEERLKRIAERQKLYNEMYETRLANEEKVDKLVLDFDPETKEELLSVHEDLVKRLKPHQAKGVKFMWDACFESIERMKSSPGSGCIIAHCMGLGKTLQVIALTHTLLVHEELGVKTVMIVCPLSTVLNWRNEFNLWLKDIEHDIEVYELTKLKQNSDRRYMLESWQRTGGVLIIGYEMFRNLSGTNNRMRKNMKESVLKCLIDPGPDIIVCDEGHLLKNEDTALSKSMNRIKTLRRIVLTGTPLQNNLIEYHCMVQFIKPNLLGTKKEFLNRFANPITNGQFDDSTEYDVKLMKKRAYVLHKMLKGCVQRFDYSVLMPFLPPKQEYVIFVSLTEVQINLYRHYLENFARQKRSGGGFLFTDFQALQRIWTHPLVLQLNAEKVEKINGRRYTSDSEGSLRSFIDDDTETTTTTSSSSDENDDDVQAIDSDVPKKSTRQNKIEPEVTPKVEESEVKEEAWWSQFVQPEHFEDIRVSSKLLLLFGILKECEQIGDKILVFSQSLYSLTLIERFLEKIDNETQNGTSSECIDGHSGSWSLGLDYFRLDGQTSAENRNTWCKIFNQPSNMRARLFLISTRAGGLGINLTAANRVIIFDASWNPSHDVQSIFRVYRFGQKKPCYVYRFLAAGTMEEKIYNRQVTKLSLSCRVVDVQQIERHYSNHDLSELYKFEPNPNNGEKTLNLPKDRLLAEIFLKYKKYVENYHEHDSLLENKAEEELNEEERKQAWLEYEEEKKGRQMPPPQTMTLYPNSVMLNQYNLTSPLDITTDYEKLQELIRKDYPNATPEYQQMVTARVLTDMYNYWEQQTYNSNKRLIEQNLSTKAPILRAQMLNVAQTSYGLHNATLKPANPVIPTTPASSDNDVIEIISPPTNKTNKSKEE
ncbi:uncharacterized protein LOC100874907 [Megachile rotundata]|uniref:uncharacterized protein LOC100874907 n=1 Tax=Megachile rotundata TaxID=143995 RepID=UPI000258F0E0|nr:PREDICTED: transcriptional regulator ATRX homolog [Megachile rotundata]